MAVLMIAELPNLTESMYAHWRAASTFSMQTCEGFIFHVVNGLTPHGESSGDALTGECGLGRVSRRRQMAGASNGATTADARSQLAR